MPATRNFRLNDLNQLCELESMLGLQANGAMTASQRGSVVEDIANRLVSGSIERPPDKFRVIAVVGGGKGPNVHRICARASVAVNYPD